MATEGTDRARHHYIQIPTRVGGEHLRFTFIPSPSYDADRPTVRMTIVNSKGRVRQGPEVPVELLGEIEKAFEWVREQVERSK